MEEFFEYLLQNINLVLGIASALLWVALLALRYLPRIHKDWKQPQPSSRLFKFLIVAIPVLALFYFPLKAMQDGGNSSEQHSTTTTEDSHDKSSELAYAALKQSKLEHAVTRTELEEIKNEQIERAVNQFNRGVRHLVGEDVDAEKAFIYFEIAAEQGFDKAQFNLALMYDEGKGVAQNDEKAVYWYQTAAEQGYAKAQFNLALMYRNGEGVAQNDEKAVYWYQTAAEQGDALAQNNLALMYRNGEGVAQNDEKAVYWYQTAAEQGYVKAQFNLAVMYDEGEDVAQNDEKAAYWYQTAAEQGNASAQNNIGWMYATGRGVTQDDEKAVQWYQKAADQGNATAQGNLAVMYANGAGVRQDDEKAVQWYQKAVQQFSGTTKFTQEEEQKKIQEAEQKGDAYYLYNLGYMYAFGARVTQDHEKAADWLTQASQQGYIHATRVLELLKKVK